MGYRDASEALAQRETNLARELDELDAELQRLRGLEGRRESLLRELHEVRDRRRLRPAGMRPLPSASPCRADWASMLGEGRCRECHLCGKHAYDVKGLTAVEAKELVARHEGPSALISLRQREDGTVVAGDCPVGSRLRRGTRRVVTAGTSLTVALTMMVASAISGEPCASHGPSTLAGSAAKKAPSWAQDGAPPWDATPDIELDNEYEIDRDESQEGLEGTTNYDEVE
ncbi:MAG: hypothetical protein AAGA56_18345 [Myxococcota bacterium]